MRLQTTHIYSIVRLLNHLYKQGVVDASRVDNRIICEDYLDTFYGTGRYGTLQDKIPIHWSEWRARINGMLGKCKSRNVDALFLQIKTHSGKYAPILPVAMDFYMQGVRDYLAHPYSKYIPAFFKDELRVWDGAHMIKYKSFCKVKRSDIGYAAQSFCAERAKLDAEFLENLNPDELLYRKHQQVKRNALNYADYEWFSDLFIILSQEQKRLEERRYMTEYERVSLDIEVLERKKLSIEAELEKLYIKRSGLKPPRKKGVGRPRKEDNNV